VEQRSHSALKCRDFSPLDIAEKNVILTETSIQARLRILYRTFVETHFTAAHQLHGYPGHCGRLHGHTWKVRVEIETPHVDEIGLSIDFRDLKRRIEVPLNRLDHFHLNEVPPFDRENPTAETLARFIFHEVKKDIPAGFSLCQVTVWESEHHGVTYSEP
jgi:6-pyruvoyltetrahydropterin/6-carboxytetrahydropterin synthase